ncbi:MAG: LPS biosynthesis glycosyltransferase [Planctomycetaceae bacterium]
MKIVEYFDKIRVINLPTRPDRRRQIARELSRHGMPLQPGKVELFEAIRPEDDGGFPTLGLHGGFLSHLGVLKEARAAGLARVLHIEDDLQISRRFEECQEALVDQLRNVEWGLVYFGHPIELESTPVPTLVPYSKPFVLAHFFGVNGIIFDRLVDFLERLRRRPPGHPDGGPMSIDGALNTFRPRIRTS